MVLRLHILSLLGLQYLLALNSKILGQHMNPCETGRYLGDAALTLGDFEAFRRRKRRAVTNEKERVWPDGIIPYVVKSTFDGKDRVIIDKAIQHWETQTCLSFIPRTKEKNYIVFQQDGNCGCCSYVGKRGGGRSQGVNLGADCLQLGTVIHELGHVIGFWHEHTRPDRDAYVNILRKNILQSELKNFRRLTTEEINSFGVPYDFRSIMHYAPSAFSKNKLEATILPRPSNIDQSVLGQRKNLSEYDKLQANLLYKCIACQVTSAQSKGNFTFSRTRYSKQSSQTCIWRILASPGEKIIVRFRFHRFRYGCRKVYLKIRKGKHKNTPLINTFCKSNPPPKEFTIESDAVWMKFHYGHKYYYGGSKRLGVDIEYEVFCGGNITETHGVINSPNYPDYYEANKTCIWNIHVPKNYRIVLKFMMFRLEKSKNCNYDYVEVTDGKRQKSIGRFCGTRLPPVLSLPGNTARVTFHSDGHINKAGFSLKFNADIDECSKNNPGCSHFCVSTVNSLTCSCPPGYKLKLNGKDCEVESKCGKDNGGCQHRCHEAEEGPVCSCYKGYKLLLDGKACTKVRCGFTANIFDGWVATPDYPDMYTAPRKCKWVISTREGQQYKVVIKELTMAHSSRVQCTTRTFTLDAISNGVVTKQHSLSKLCYVRDHEFYTSGDKIRISIEMEEGQSIKFNISLKSVCGGHLFAKRQSNFFFSHLHYNTSNYPLNEICEWVIDGKHHSVVLRFQDFELESGSCSYDSVKIYDGKTTKANEMAELCGKKLTQKEFKSTSRYLRIVFTTDGSVKERGFMAVYSKVTRRRRRGYRNYNLLHDARRTRDFYPYRSVT